MKISTTIRPGVRVALLGLGFAAVAAAPSAGDLAGRLAAGQQRAGALSSSIQADNGRIAGYEGSISSLQTRLDVIQHSVSVQEGLLSLVRSQLNTARTRLSALRIQYFHGRRVLAGELLAAYESPAPTIVGVIVNSQGFDDLLNRVSDLRTIERQNVRMVRLVASQRQAVATQARRLAVVAARRQRATAAVLVERDQVAQLKLSIVSRELTIARSRDRKREQLTNLRATLSQEAAKLNRQAAAAQAASFSGGAGGAPAGCVNTTFVPHGGTYGFFPASGTNYSVGLEPVLAARLDALGRAFQLQLTGISGYRSPQHSVEVGGFADDPHTRGLASDTPGVEGVPESALNHFCLTRPFGGAAEADHIQGL